MAPQNPDWSSDFDAIEARRAPVAPRVSLHPGQASLPIDHQVRALLDKRVGGAVCLSGESGSGKTTALRHLAAAMGPGSKVMLVDRPLAGDRPTVPPGSLLVYSSPQLVDPGQCVLLKMSPWGNEDLIEYLLATHPGRCRSVMDRLMLDPSGASSLNGLPELWRIVVDEMAADDAVQTIDSAIDRCLARQLLDSTEWERAGKYCLCLLAPWAGFLPEEMDDFPECARLLRHGVVKMILASRQLAKGLCDGTVHAELHDPLPAELIERAGRIIAFFPAAVRTLNSMVESMDSNIHAMAASLLHASGVDWKPARRAIINLSHARLNNANWTGIELPAAEMGHIELRRAILDEADFSKGRLEFAKLAGASLRKAVLEEAYLSCADLTNADLGWARADGVQLISAKLTGAGFHRASLRKACFRGANLARTVFLGADLSEADLRESTLDDTDFTGAIMDGADLHGLPVRCARLNGARLCGADLRQCNLEGMKAKANFARAKFDRALLTGAVLRDCNFRSAELTGCGLADIDLEGADLMNADLRGSTFHMGTTRSGLVASHVPGEGSRMGFYTDDFQDRDFKDPRDIRKANLCNADLRGAKIDKVDFYLVDLRGARYSRKQRDWFLRCGAILGD